MTTNNMPAPTPQQTELEKAIERFQCIQGLRTSICCPFTLELLTAAKRTANLDAAIPHLNQIISSQDDRIKDLEQKLQAVEKERDELKEWTECLKRLDAAKSPFCEHNQQYLWSPDGQGKRIICLRCSYDQLKDLAEKMYEALNLARTYLFARSAYDTVSKAVTLAKQAGIGKSKES